MPFKSEKQRKWMHANKPKMAKKWEKEEEAMDEYKKFRGKMTYGDAKPKKGDYVKTIAGIAQIEKIRGSIAYMKLPGKKTKGYWMNDLKNLKSTDKKEKGKDLWTEGKVNEARSINVEPNWEGVWRYFKHIQKTSPGQWSKMKGQFRASWINLQRMADKKGWKSESVKEERDYKDEYKKFQSSTKSKKYRAELNKYNRKRGTYGNGDGKDASHKGGKIAGFEKESTNRGRAEKSRLRKEVITMFEAKFTDDTLAPRIKHWSKQHKGTGIGYGHVLGHLAVHMKEMGWNKSYKEVARIAVELGKKRKVESVDESGILYRAGVKKYGKEGMRKIQQAAGKRKSHAEIGKIKDKYEKGKNESVNEGTKAFLAYRKMKEGMEDVMKSMRIFRKFIDDAPYNPKFGMITKELYKWEIDLEKKYRRVVPQISKISKDKALESVNEKMGPEQYHKYLQYVFDTQFKTSDEKKMKKSMIKKINVSQKKKGLPLFKESDLGLTYKKGKTVKVKHKKSGKELVIVDKPNVRKEYEKIGFYVEGKVNEAKKENPITVAKRIIKNKQHEKVDGVLIDTQTANLIVQIYKAVKPVNKKKMEKMPMKTLGHLAWKAVGGK